MNFIPNHIAVDIIFAMIARDVPINKCCDWMPEYSFIHSDNNHIQIIIHIIDTAIKNAGMNVLII